MRTTIHKDSSSFDSWYFPWHANEIIMVSRYDFIEQPKLEKGQIGSGDNPLKKTPKRSKIGTILFARIFQCRFDCLWKLILPEMNMAMQTIITKLKTLKKMLQTEEDFQSTFNYFFDHFSQDNLFIDSSKKTKHPFLKQVLKTLGKQIFNTDVMITHLMILKFPKAQFYHGTCFMQGRMTAFFFFEDIDMGMSCVHYSNEAKYTRFTGKRVQGGNVIVPPGESSSTVH